MKHDNAPIVAMRGNKIRTKHWRTEALLRMLENVLEVGERPEDLVVYASIGKAARDWQSYYKIREALINLAEDETLVIQSGKPVAIFRTQKSVPRVLLANCNLVGRWATSEHFYSLYSQGKIAWGGLTAGCWQYIGFQGVLQGTFETFSAVAETHFGVDHLKGKWVVTAGLGGMGSAQPLGIVMLDGVALVAEVNAERAYARKAAGLCMEVTKDIDEAIKSCEIARQEKRPWSIAWIGNAVDLLEALIAKNIKPDIVTDMTSAHDALNGYQPVGFSIEEMAELRINDPDKASYLAKDSMVRHVKALLAFKNMGIVTFDYGNNLRSQARDHGFPDGFQVKVFTEAYLRPLFCQGIGPFRWIALSGETADIHRIDKLILDLFPERSKVQRWIANASKHVPFQGLPARTAWLGHGERTKAALAINELVGRGELAAPIAFSRDHLDAASMAHPNIMTENLKDGTDAVADWPLLNALVNTSTGADLVAIHSGGGDYAGYMTSAGVTSIADGTEEAAIRLERVMNADTGLGVIRYMDAGYDLSAETAQASGINVLL